MITAATINLVFAVLNPIAYGMGGVALTAVITGKIMDRKIVTVRKVRISSKN